MAILLPPLLASICCISIPTRQYTKMHAIGILSALVVMCTTLYVTYAIYNSKFGYVLQIGSIMNSPVIDLVITGRAALFCLMIGVLYPISITYAIVYTKINKTLHLRPFFCFMHLSVLFGMALGMSANLITMFIFYEMITLTTYPLVVHNRDKEAKYAGRTYLTYLIASSSFLFLPAILIIQSTTGGTTFIYGGILSGQNMSDATINILFAMVVFGIAKTAILPMHSWLPGAMGAPTPVSAILHAVVVVKSGLFALISVIYFIFGNDLLKNSLYKIYGENWLTVLSITTIVTMSIAAVFQDKIKKRLAYSTIAQLSYAILAASILSYGAMKAALMLMMAHAFAKITLFFGAGIIYSYFHKDRLDQIHGIGKSMFISALAMAIACISLIGLPITVGFSAKYRLLAIITQHQNLTTILAVILATLLSVSYCFPIVYNTIFSTDQDVVRSKENIDKYTNIVVSSIMAICTINIVVLFFVSNILADLIDVM